MLLQNMLAIAFTAFLKVVANFCLFSSIHSCVFAWWFVDFCFSLSPPFLFQVTVPVPTFLLMPHCRGGKVPPESAAWQAISQAG